MGGIGCIGVGRSDPLQCRSRPAAFTARPIPAEREKLADGCGAYAVAFVWRYSLLRSSDDTRACVLEQASIANFARDPAVAGAQISAIIRTNHYLARVGF